MRIRLFTADLTYGAGLTLHTAASGAVDHLEEIYLYLEDGAYAGIGEVRANAAYLTGIAPTDLLAGVRQAMCTISADTEPEKILAALESEPSCFTAPVRMLIDSALRDLAANKRGISIAESLAGEALPLAAKTNQTLFWSPIEEFRDRAHDYVRRGFRDLKVRIGIASFEEDLARLRWLRSAFGQEIEISVDANGTWPTREAQRRLEALADLDVAYVEQPVAAAAWDAIEIMANHSPLPIMLDESLASATDVRRVCAIGGKLEAHVKLLKLGGIGAALAAVRALTRAGIPVMVGQMNEGAAATAAAIQLAVTVRAKRAELYGADGIVNDPVSGVAYGEGLVHIAGKTGLGVAFDSGKARQIMEIAR